MIIARSPLRITLGGGGTDLPSYYREHEGFLLSAAIDKYVFVTVTRPFTEGVYLKYSHLEHVDKIAQVQHPIIREGLSLLGFKTPQVEITTLADIPAGTGLGSSGSFTTALLKALYTHRRRHLNRMELADRLPHRNRPAWRTGRQAGPVYRSRWRRDLLRLPHRRHGGGDAARHQHGHDVRPGGNLLLFFTGFSRNAGSILKDQNTRTKQSDGEMLKNLHYVKELGHRSKQALEKGEHPSLRRVDARALGTQETSFRGHEQSKNRRVV